MMIGDPSSNLELPEISTGLYTGQTQPLKSTQQPQFQTNDTSAMPKQHPEVNNAKNEAVQGTLKTQGNKTTGSSQSTTPTQQEFKQLDVAVKSFLSDQKKYGDIYTKEIESIDPSLPDAAKNKLTLDYQTQKAENMLKPNADYKAACDTFVKQLKTSNPITYLTALSDAQFEKLQKDNPQLKRPTIEQDKLCTYFVTKGMPNTSLGDYFLLPENADKLDKLCDCMANSKDYQDPTETFNWSLDNDQELSVQICTAYVSEAEESLKQQIAQPMLAQMQKQSQDMLQKYKDAWSDDDD